MPIKPSYEMATFVAQDMTFQKIFDIGVSAIMQIARRDPTDQHIAINHLWTYGDLHKISGCTQNKKIVRVILHSKIGQYLREVALSKYNVDCSNPINYIFIVPAYLALELYITSAVDKLVEYSREHIKENYDQDGINALTDRVLVLSVPDHDYCWTPGQQD